MCLINTYAVQKQFEEYYVTNQTLQKKYVFAISSIYQTFLSLQSEPWQRRIRQGAIFFTVIL